MIETETPYTLWIVIFLAFLGAMVLFVRLQKSFVNIRRLRRMKRGIEAEAKGAKILKKYGFEIMAVQQSATVKIMIDGQLQFYEIRPDAMAKRKGEKFAVEIKTGNAAPSPLFRDTRRQLMEYFYTLAVDGVLLVNADSEEVSEIRFMPQKSSKMPLMQAPSRWKIFFAFFLGMLVSAAYFTLYT